MVYLEDLRELVEILHTNDKIADEYMRNLSNVDPVLGDVIIENKYTNILFFEKDFLLKKYLGDELFDYVMWFVYDKPNVRDSEEPNVVVNNVGYTVTGLDSFMDFAQHGLCIPMRPKQES